MRFDCSSNPVTINRWSISIIKLSNCVSEKHWYVTYYALYKTHFMYLNCQNIVSQTNNTGTIPIVTYALYIKHISYHPTYHAQMTRSLFG